MRVVLTAILETYKKLKDGGMKITIETGELGAEQILGIHEMCNKNIYVVFGESPVSYDDIKDDLPEALESTPKKRSSSQKLRAVLYRLWEQSGEGGEFNDYYERMMEKIIDFYKDKLE